MTESVATRPPFEPLPGLLATASVLLRLAKGLTYKTASGEERTVSRRALYNAFKAYDAERSETP